MKILVAINSAWNFVNFRSGLIRRLVSMGHEVVAVAPRDSYVEALQNLGCRYMEIQLDSGGKSFLSDLGYLYSLRRILKNEQPDIFLSFTPKPNIYGSIVSRLLGIPSISNVAGLGNSFRSGRLLSMFIGILYRLAFARSHVVFFQNQDDLKLFVDEKLVKRDHADLVPGSGVDLKRFAPEQVPPQSCDGGIRFLLFGRLLWDKGVGVYVEAARILAAKGLNAECLLLGFCGVDNPAAISLQNVEQWVREGSITYLGVSDSVEDVLKTVHCVVLPSWYLEGVPRSLLEAAACGRPIITTRHVGCKEVVNDGVNGYFCESRSASSLASAMERFIRLSEVERQAMGSASRSLAEERFSEEIVISQYVKAIESGVSTR